MRLPYLLPDTKQYYHRDRKDCENRHGDVQAGVQRLIGCRLINKHYFFSFKMPYFFFSSLHVGVLPEHLRYLPCVVISGFGVVHVRVVRHQYTPDKSV